MKIFLVFLATAVGFLLPKSNLSASETTGEIYAVIEVGASGIKGVVVQTVAPDPESPPAKALKLYQPLDKNSFLWDSAASGKAAAAVEQVHRQMQQDYDIPIGHFYVVGSSGVPEDVRDRLSETIQDQVRAKMEFITSEDEAALLFRGIVPVRRFNQVVVIDIGSGNTKGAYAEGPQSKARFETFQFPWGTKTWAQEINQTRGDGSFGVAAEVLGHDKLATAVKQIVLDKPGLLKMRRVYLAGGITWAMATLLHPFNQSTWVRINPADIDSFYEKATTDPYALLHPELDKVPKSVGSKDLAAAKQKAKEEVERVAKVFSEDQLMAGAQILRILKESADFEKKDAIFFAGKALYAWPLGYVLEKISVDTAAR